ncbi:hypothetical protein AKJ41_02865 [candidate division MSBL1 archaeon SCGC-AAA259O05]|uniref:Large ribosomal subunit protein uL30 n=1 Tax=candidate division MSBL1 archaeon SCGC-AAA259O05 TaxID=1698271 RepID=A0A133V3L8_9EURY|nr:hypothetical protein AKJ41_02865 [candidate division MSBL1 archaeon SCGC-AAA259O05]
MTKLAVVRIRGSVDVEKEVEDTLRMLRLTRPNHSTLVDDSSPQGGMLQKAKEMVTWGPIKPEVLESLLKKRGELVSGGSVTDEVVRKSSSYETVGELSKAICEEKAELDDVNGLRKVFRLRPPKKGYSPTQRSYSHGGASGDRGEKINDLLTRMI